MNANDFTRQAAALRAARRDEERQRHRAFIVAKARRIATATTTTTNEVATIDRSLAGAGMTAADFARLVDLEFRAAELREQLGAADEWALRSEAADANRALAELQELATAAVVTRKVDKPEADAIRQRAAAAADALNVYLAAARALAEINSELERLST